MLNFTPENVIQYEKLNETHNCQLIRSEGSCQRVWNHRLVKSPDSSYQCSGRKEYSGSLKRSITVLPQSIINMIRAKFGRDEIYAGDCAYLAGSIGIGEATVKRMLGLVGEKERNRIPHVGTMDILAN